MTGDASANESGLRRTADAEHASFDEGCRLILALAEATQKFGVSYKGAWEALTRVGGAMGLNVKFIATPNYVHSVVWRGDEEQRTYVTTARSGAYDLTKLAQATQIANGVETGAILPREALERLREVDRAPPTYGAAWNAIAYVLCGCAFAVILRASWLDVLFGGLLSLVSYASARWAARSDAVAMTMELLAALLTSIVATLIAALVRGVNPQAVTLCALICLVPGFGFAVAPYELFVGNALSGLTWLANASMSMAKLVGGAAMGFAFAQRFWHVAATAPGAGVAPVYSWFFVPLLVVGLAVLFRVKRRDLVFVVLASWVVWGGLQLGGALGAWQGTFFGTVALVIFANVCLRTMKLSVAATMLPGIMLVVPGVPTLRAMYEVQTKGIVAGLASGSEVLLLLAAILGGELVGNALMTLRHATDRMPLQPRRT